MEKERREESGLERREESGVLKKVWSWVEETKKEENKEKFKGIFQLFSQKTENSHSVLLSYDPSLVLSFNEYSSPSRLIAQKMCGWKLENCEAENNRKESKSEGEKINGDNKHNPQVRESPKKSKQTSLTIQTSQRVAGGEGEERKERRGNKWRVSEKQVRELREKGQYERAAALCLFDLQLSNAIHTLQMGFDAFSSSNKSKGSFYSSFSFPSFFLLFFFSSSFFQFNFFVFFPLSFSCRL